MKNEFYVTEDQAGRRVDRLLRKMYPAVPLGAIMKALRKGDVRLNGNKTAANARLEVGQFLQVPWDSPENDSLSYDSIKDKNPSLLIETIYRDDHIWVVDKPAGLLTQPDQKLGDSLITRALVELKWHRVDFRPATVQRLDRNTSGALIIAMSGVALRNLTELIRERKIKKIYYALVKGEIDKEGVVEAPLLKDSKNNIVTVDNKMGLPALTRYRRLYTVEGRSMVEIELITGRSHQARAHMASIGHPILGDRKYGGGDEVRRPMLHSYSIGLPVDNRIPKDIQRKEFFAPIPKDMSSIMERDRKFSSTFD